jgi:hypothetical protein
MTRVTTIIAIAAMLIFPPAGTFALQTDDEIDDVSNRVKFKVGRVTYDLDPAVAVNACIEATDDTIFAETTTVTLQMFGRTTGPEGFVVLGRFETLQTDDLSGHPIGYCVPMRGE